MIFRRDWLIVGLIGVVTAGVVTLGYHYYARPAVLRVAVGPPGSDDVQLVSGIAPRLVAEGAPFRWRQVVADTPAEAGKMLERGTVNMAIVRQDQPLPTNAQAIAVFHRNIIVLMTKPSTEIHEISQLAGKTVGAVGRNGVNSDLLAQLLPHYGLAPISVKVVSIAPGDADKAIADGSISAVLVTGPITGRAVTQTIAALTPENDPDVIFIPFANAEAVAKRLPAFEATEIDAGSFGGSPARPLASVDTLQFSHFLVTTPSMSDAMAADVARYLFILRPGLALDFPGANRLQAPDTAKDAIVPVHPGAAAYFDGEEKSFFDEYSDLFYLALAGFGVVGSAFASIQRFASPAGGIRDRELFRKMRELIEQVRTTTSDDELCAIELELHEIFVVVLSKAEKNALEDAQLGALSISVQHLLRAIDSRRTALGKTLPPPQNSS